MQIICYIHNKSTCSNKQSNLKHTICFLFRVILIDGTCLWLKWFGIEILLQLVLQSSLKVSFLSRSAWFSLTASWTSQQYSTAYFKRRSFWFSFHHTNYKTDFLAKSLTNTNVFFVRNLSATQTSNSQIVQIHIPQTDYPSL